MTLAAGIDVGTSSVKAALASGGAIVGVFQDKTRRRDPRLVVADVYAALLAKAGVSKGDVDYVASTGEGELVEFRDAHFYGMTTHARGGLFLVPEARAVVDLGALHTRAMRVDEHARVLSGRMTSQCASGTGQFLENIARYLGVALDEVGAISQTAQKAERISGICAVLAETDVINMVSRGIKTAEILRGIHESMAGRFVKLLRSSEAHGVVAVTGGLAADTGLLAAMRDEIAESGLDLAPVSHPQSVYAGAIGAALWGEFRFAKLNAQDAEARACSS